MKRLKFNDLVREFAEQYEIPYNEARKNVLFVFALINSEVLDFGRNVTIPSFGTFRAATTKGGTRLVCGRKVRVEAGKRIAFRASKNARA